jgi:hypothetical protein
MLIFESEQRFERLLSYACFLLRERHGSGAGDLLLIDVFKLQFDLRFDLVLMS